MAKRKIRPKILYADSQGNIFDHPHLELLCKKGEQLEPARPNELIPLPEGSDLFLLPGRAPLGFDPKQGSVEIAEGTAVAAFISPGHTLTATPAFHTQTDAPMLPLFSYGAVGYANGRFYVGALKTDNDPRQVFTNIQQKTIDKGVHWWRTNHPDNRLVAHLTKCALTYCCPAAKNLALGRYEAPLPVSRTCNARCVGCISKQDPDTGFCATQDRISFTPTPREIADIMISHANREKKPIFSFGQGCEGEPLTEADVIQKAIQLFSKATMAGTVNINTNGSLPGALASLCEAGLTSTRISLNSARTDSYARYYRPQGYTFDDVEQSLAVAQEKGLFVSLNFLYFPGVSDTEEEFDALCSLVQDKQVRFIQMRNLNLDPELYLDLMNPTSPSMGLENFMKRIQKECPWVRFGYFNPYVT